MVVTGQLRVSVSLPAGNEAVVPLEKTKPHTVRTMKTVSTYYKFEALPYIARGPRTSPPGFGLFPELKEPLRGL